MEHGQWSVSRVKEAPTQEGPKSRPTGITVAFLSGFRMGLSEIDLLEVAVISVNILKASEVRCDGWRWDCFRRFWHEY